MRRDGSIEGPLKATQIVEWCRINFLTTNGSPVAAEKQDDNNAINQEQSHLKILEQNLREQIAEGNRELEKRLVSMERSLEERHNDLCKEYSSIENVNGGRITLVCNLL